MSSGKLGKMYQERKENFNENISERDIDISQLVVPFSKLFRNYESHPDIYSGNEKIPFKERDPDYKLILRQEFANTLKVEFKIFKSIVKFPSL